MDDRSSTSKPANAISSPSPSTTPDLKSPTQRPLYSSKLGDQRARPTDAPASNPTVSSRQPPAQQKAWTSAKNPITGRSQTPKTNFNSQKPSPSVTSSLNSLREGQQVRFVLASQAEYEGTYANSSDPGACRLTRVVQKKLPKAIENTNGQRKEMMAFQRKDITDVVVLPGSQGKLDTKAPNGSRSSFQTDTAISKNRFGNERVLQRWDGGSASDALEDTSLESHGKGEKWDQFAANESLFGLTTNYHEEFYTTPLNKGDANWKERVAKADQKAREITQSPATTAHVAEERVMDYEGGDGHDDRNEEENGVRRQEFPALSNRENKYTPPARRAPTAHSTVKGAPVDPAIISSVLKSVPGQKQATSKGDEVKASSQGNKESSSQGNKESSKQNLENNPPGSKPEIVENKPAESKLATKPSETKPSDKNATPVRPSAATSRTISPQVKDGATSGDTPGTTPGVRNATETVERDVYLSFKNFAAQQRANQEKSRSTKMKQDKEVKLIELKNFANSFKLSTPVPDDLIPIIAKDRAKQQQIKEKALINAEEVAKQKAAEVAAIKEKDSAAVKETQPKATTEQTAASVAAVPVDPRTSSRPSAPQHSSSSGLPNRHTGGRSSYNNQPHYNQYNRNNRPQPHLGAQNQPTGHLAQRLRNVEQQKMQHPHMGQHPQVQDMRLPPTGPANGADPTFGRRLGAGPPSFQGAKLLNPNSHEFRPSAFAAPFTPVGPSQGSSPRSSVNNIPEAPPSIPPVPGQLIRRRTKAIDVKKCFILSHVESIQPPAGRDWSENDGLRPSFDTLPTWRQLQDETERPDSTMHMTYKEYFDKLPLTNAAVATPNPSHALPQVAHQHQLPFHLQQHGAQNMAPRQSPHIPPMQMHVGQHGGHVPHGAFSAPDDHRMMHSNSAQSFASPRMGQVPIAYAPTMNAPGQMPYAQQPVMQPFMTPGAPQMGHRSFSNNPQFMPQQPHYMGNPMLVQQPQYMPPGGMVTAGPQVQVYHPAHAQFLPPGAVPPQPMPVSNGFPSPGRPAAPMMAHQGSHQGQPVYGMSPGMPYQQPAYPPQQPQGKFSNQRPQ
ncbi:hypothetical protein B0H66DRAFT_482269 [Apodospora peruviana]|uniref:LsmAD domain-containing protein n=1 Tax=Apodospora peruviana TaxID=516989 RepID=A0AAE0HZK8_9PEZI|nr:hypothetical protein B0H66DRAFT_482269 [Apodospora peruviana]